MRRRRMGRPGLVGTAARTAVVAGTATAVVGHSQNKRAAKEQAAAEQQAAAQQQQWDQQQQWAAQQAAAAPPPPPAGGVSEEGINQLKELAALHEQGVLTDVEFDAQKAKILAG